MLHSRFNKSLPNIKSTHHHSKVDHFLQCSFFVVCTSSLPSDHQHEEALFFEFKRFDASVANFFENSLLHIKTGNP